MANRGNPMNRTAFSRTSPTTPAGGVGAFICECIVESVDMCAWSINVRTVFDRKSYPNVQVASPYMHPNTGEGIYCVPEPGSKCLVCIPSEGAPPFVLAFIMPASTVDDATTEDAPLGTQPDSSGNGGKGSSTYAGGRSRRKPGDIVLRGRDGNFMILHRGGVAQFGATSMAQRICVPLGNIVTDISGRYEHFNTGGTELWGLQERGGTLNQQVYRVYADDEFADIRVSSGKVSGVHEPVGSVCKAADEDNLVFEFALAPGGFDDVSCSFTATPAAVKFRLALDRSGNGIARFEGSVDLHFRKNLRAQVDGNLDITVKKVLSLVVGELANITGGKRLSLSTDGGVLVLNGGTTPVAQMGGVVNVVTPVLPPLVVTTPDGVTVIGVVTPGQMLTGTIEDGNTTILT